MQETKIPMFQRLSAPDAQTWNGGRITDTDILTLSEAASMASKQAGQDVSVSDFLRAAARGEILMMGITKKSSKTEPCTAGDALLNDGKPVPEGCLINLPLEACQGLANVGRASWRILYDRWQLTQDEPDFLTLPDDCRVSGEATRALAAAFTARNDASVSASGADVSAVEQPKKWTDEKIAEMRAYREKHTAQETGDRYGISRQRVDELLKKDKTPSSLWGGLTHRIR